MFMLSNSNAKRNIKRGVGYGQVNDPNLTITKHEVHGSKYKCFRIELYCRWRWKAYNLVTSNLMSFRKSGQNVFQTPVKSSSSGGINLTASGSTRFSQPQKPAIKPSNEIFEPQLKWILRRRLVRVVVVCGIVALAASAASNASSIEEWLVWSLQSAFKASVWLTGGMIPAIIARKFSVRGACLIHSYIIFTLSDVDQHLLQ